MSNPQETIRTSEAQIKELEARLEELGHTGSAHDIPRETDDITLEKLYQPFERIQLFYHRTDTLDLRMSILFAYLQKAEAHVQLGQAKEAFDCYLRADASLKSIGRTLAYAECKIKLGE